MYFTCIYCVCMCVHTCLCTCILTHEKICHCICGSKRQVAGVIQFRFLTVKAPENKIGSIRICSKWFCLLSNFSRPLHPNYYPLHLSSHVVPKFLQQGEIMIILQMWVCSSGNEVPGQQVQWPWKWYYGMEMQSLRESTFCFYRGPGLDSQHLHQTNNICL